MATRKPKQLPTPTHPTEPGGKWPTLLPAPAAAVAGLTGALTRFDSVLGVGFGPLENSKGLVTGENGLIVFTDPNLRQELTKVKAELKKVAEASAGGHPMMMRRPRTTFKAYHEFLRKNGEKDLRRFYCLPDPFWLDFTKVRRLFARRASRLKRAPARQPQNVSHLAALAAPVTSISGEIFVIKDHGTLVTGESGLQVVDYQQVLDLLFEQLGDHYDLVYIHHHGIIGDLAGGTCIPVFNDVQGINHHRGIFDDRAAWNSTRLQAVQAITGFDLRVMLHETAHRWLAYANHRTPGSTVDDKSLHTFTPVSYGDQELLHWGNWYDNDRSPMDYDKFDWEDAPMGKFKRVLVTQNQFANSPVDLYLMGLLEATEVPGFRYLENPVPTTQGRYTATPHGLGIADIINAHGPRVPAAPVSQRIFHQAYIFLTTAAAVPQSLVTSLNAKRRIFESRFRVVTNNRAVIDTRLLRSGFPDLRVGEVWVRQSNDYGESHQNARQSQDNHLRARILNDGSFDYADVTVRFYIGSRTSLAGGPFLYPRDWKQSLLLGEATIAVSASGATIAKVIWKKNMPDPVELASLLVEVLPMDLTPTTLHTVASNKKLAQRDIEITG